jgi:adenosylcobyric acid synthase
MAKAIMIQGTGSNVGKSMIVAGLARAFVRRGLSVRPFKPQNMSNNAAVTENGGEIGRAQALQARAAGVPAHTDMNPVLLKPQTSTSAQVIVQGKRIGTQAAAAFGARKDTLMAPVLESFARLASSCDLVLIEGAGSPAETNLRARDIANMGFACAANVPVILMGDIDRGGVIAQIVGTQAVLSTQDREMICGFAVNKFRGDRRLFDGGRDDICQRTGWPSLGVLPWFEAAHKLPAEDVMDLPTRTTAQSGKGALVIAVPVLPRIANFDDLDPLATDDRVDLRLISRGSTLPADADLILLPGSKATLDDLQELHAEGWHIDIAAHIRRGGHVLGLCGGYQMLGHSISDPHGIEGPARQCAGLGHLNVSTVLGETKELAIRHGTHLPTGAPIEGYEIHMGQTTGADRQRGWLDMGHGPEGAMSLDGRIMGTYLHGLFSSDRFRDTFLTALGAAPTDPAAPNTGYDDMVDQTLDALADHIERYMDVDLIWSLAREVE